MDERGTRRRWIAAGGLGLIAVAAVLLVALAGGVTDDGRVEPPVRPAASPEPTREAAPRPRDVDEEEIVADVGAYEDGASCGWDEPGPHDLPSGRYRAARVTFELKFGDEVTPFALMSAFVLPGEVLDLEVLFGQRGDRFGAVAGGGGLEKVEPGRWRWTAPDAPGLHQVQVSDLTTAETICLNVFVLWPYHGEDVFHGYRIGRYERVPLRNNPAYEMPRGMVEVSEENLDIFVSPHLQLRQFVCKQSSPYPKFVVMRSRMLLKLEMLLEHLNDLGVEAATFAVLSGYRTPFYNRAIGNTTTYSRHAYGDAADVYIDEDENGRMDDVTGDGRVTIADSRLLHAFVEEIADETWYRPFIGGLGLYGPTPNHGPFIHVDTRGFRARW